MRTVFSFSAKKREDLEFIEKIKGILDKRGMSFSAFILRAIREQAKKETLDD